MFDKIKGKLLFSVGLGALVFLALSIYADFLSYLLSLRSYWPLRITRFGLRGGSIICGCYRYLWTDARA